MFAMYNFSRNYLEHKSMTDNGYAKKLGKQPFLVQCDKPKLHFN